MINKELVTYHAERLARRVDELIAWAVRDPSKSLEVRKEILSTVQEAIFTTEIVKRTSSQGR